ncbi:MAG: adenylate kinase [Arcanobacterium sp.]
MSYRLILVGPPGAGKGTQAKIVSEKLGIPAISTGDIFRAEIKSGSDIGNLAADYIQHGNLVPDEVTDEIVRRRLAQPDAANGFLLDGYPRNTHQVEALDKILDELGTHIDAIVEIVVPDQDIVRRLLSRAKIEGRKDDRADVIHHRINVYRLETEPVVEAYEERGQLIAVDGTGTVGEVYERLLAAIKMHIGEK